MRFAACFLLSATAVCYAESANDCDYAGTQQQMNTCAAQEFHRADDALNVEYQRVMATLRDAQRQTLREAQRTWLKQRDPTCRAQADEEAEGGSIWPVIFNSCRTKMTEARTSEIQATLK